MQPGKGDGLVDLTQEDQGDVPPLRRDPPRTAGALADRRDGRSQRVPGGRRERHRDEKAHGG
jgi:hypothetical protein